VYWAKIKESFWIALRDLIAFPIYSNPESVIILLLLNDKKIQICLRITELNPKKEFLSVEEASNFC